MRTRKQAPPATLETVASDLEKLSRHVEALGKAVEQLANRIQPYEPDSGDAIVSDRFKWDPPPRTKPKPDLPSLARVLQEADHRLLLSEADVNAIRSRIDQISNDTYLRADLKQWIDSANKRNR